MAGPVRHVMGGPRCKALEKWPVMGYTFQSGHCFGVQSRGCDRVRRCLRSDGPTKLKVARGLRVEPGVSGMYPRRPYRQTTPASLQINRTFLFGRFAVVPGFLRNQFPSSHSQGVRRNRLFEVQRVQSRLRGQGKHCLGLAPTRCLIPLTALASFGPVPSTKKDQIGKRATIVRWVKCRNQEVQSMPPALQRHPRSQSNALRPVAELFQLLLPVRKLRKLGFDRLKTGAKGWPNVVFEVCSHRWTIERLWYQCQHHSCQWCG